MSKVNKIICDRCDKELTEDEDKYTLNTIQPSRNEGGFRIYNKLDRIDLCKRCFNEFRKFLEK